MTARSILTKFRRLTVLTSTPVRCMLWVVYLGSSCPALDSDGLSPWAMIEQFADGPVNIGPIYAQPLRTHLKILGTLHKLKYAQMKLRSHTFLFTHIHCLLWLSMIPLPCRHGGDLILIYCFGRVLLQLNCTGFCQMWLFSLKSQENSSSLTTLDTTSIRKYDLFWDPLP